MLFTTVSDASLRSKLELIQRLLDENDALHQELSNRKEESANPRISAKDLKSLRLRIEARDLPPEEWCNFGDYPATIERPCLECGCDFDHENGGDWSFHEDLFLCGDCFPEVVRCGEQRTLDHERQVLFAKQLGKEGALEVAYEALEKAAKACESKQHKRAKGLREAIGLIKKAIAEDVPF